MSKPQTTNHKPQTTDHKPQTMTTNKEKETQSTETTTLSTPRVVVLEQPAELQFAQGAEAGVYLRDDRPNSDTSIGTLLAKGLLNPTPELILLSCTRATGVQHYSDFNANVGETIALYKLGDEQAKAIGVVDRVEVWLLVSIAEQVGSMKYNALENFIKLKIRNAEITGQSFVLPITASVTFKMGISKPTPGRQSYTYHNAQWTTKNELPDWVAGWLESLSPDVWLTKFSDFNGMEPRKISTPKFYDIISRSVLAASTHPELPEAVVNPSQAGGLPF